MIYLIIFFKNNKLDIDSSFIFLRKKFSLLLQGVSFITIKMHTVCGLGITQVLNFLHLEGITAISAESRRGDYFPQSTYQPLIFFNKLDLVVELVVISY